MLSSSQKSSVILLFVFPRYSRWHKPVHICAGWQNQVPVVQVQWVGWLVECQRESEKSRTFWSDDFFAQFRRWVVRTWSELDSKLLAIVLHALASGPCVHYIIALLKAWWANTKIQVASCVRYQRVCFSKWEMHGLFSDHHLRVFHLDVNLGTRAIFVNWWWCIVERTWLLDHDENGCDLWNYKSNSTWLQGTHWIINGQKFR